MRNGCFVSVSLAWTLALIGCRSQHAALGSNVLDDGAGGANAADPLAGARAFRDSFNAIAGGDQEYLTVMPTAAMGKAPDADSPDAFFQALHDVYQAESPGSLLAGGAAAAGGPAGLTDAPAGGAAGAGNAGGAAGAGDAGGSAATAAGAGGSAATAGDAAQILAATPVTIIIFPGFSSEFIDTRAFEEILAQEDSSFHKAFADALSAHQGQPEATDQRYDLTSLGQIDAPLADLVYAASIDDAGGKPLVQVMLLHTPYFSLESLGSTEDEAARLLRRLDKVFTVLPPTGPVAFLGYSRGTPLMLDTLSHATDRPWLAQVKALISLGGVTYGSDVADDINRSGTAAAKEMAALQDLTAKLQPLDGLSAPAAALQITKNTNAWTAFLAELALADPNLSPTQLAKQALGTDVRSGVATLVKFGKTSGLEHPIGDYSNNVKRFKALGQALMDGANSLTTAERSKWWSANTVPTAGITFISLTATMADPKAGATEAAFMANTTTFAPGSPDDVFLLGGYRGMVSSSGGITINDSQMVAYKSRFWPELAPLLNPAQAPMNVRWLGLVGTHHWGLALQDVNVPADGRMNPFPRVALMEALAREVLR